jgi:hypothetical protein
MADTIALARGLDIADACYLLSKEPDVYCVNTMPLAYAYVIYNGSYVIPVASNRECELVQAYLTDQLNVKVINVRYKRPVGHTFIFAPQIRRVAVGRKPECGDADYATKIDQFVYDTLDILRHLNNGRFIGVSDAMRRIQYRSDPIHDVWSEIGIDSAQFFTPNCGVPDTLWLRLEMSVHIHIPRMLDTGRTASLVNALYYTNKRYPFDVIRDRETRDYYAYGFVLRRQNHGFYYRDGEVYYGSGQLYTGPLDEYNLDPLVQVRIEMPHIGHPVDVAPGYTYPDSLHPLPVQQLVIGSKVIVEYMPDIVVPLNFIHPATTAVSALFMIQRWQKRFTRKIRRALSIIYKEQ